MKRREFTLLLGALLVPQAAFASSSAEPVTRVVARVSISTQSMKVYHEGRHIYTWPVSTAKSLAKPSRSARSMARVSNRSRTASRASAVRST